MVRDLDTTRGQDRRIGDLFQEEQNNLMQLPQEPYNNYRLIDAQVDKYQTVLIGNNRYSVSSPYVGRQVSIELGLYDVRITHKNKLLATHRREFRKNQWILIPAHYLKLLRRKTRAFKTSRILTEIENAWDPIVKQLWEIQVAKHGEDKGTKDFLDTLLFFEDKAYPEMITVMELALENRSTNHESIKLIFEMLTEPSLPLTSVSMRALEPIADFMLPEPDVTKFDLLMGEVRHG